MEEKLILFKTAKLAKKKGFNVECLQAYRIWKENIRKSETEKSALEDIQVEYEPDYRGGSWEVVKKFYQSKEHTLAPTQSLLQKWLREKHNIHVNTFLDTTGTWSQGEAVKIFYGYEIMRETEPGVNRLDCIDIFVDAFTNSYEEALEKGLYEALKLIEK